MLNADQIAIKNAVVDHGVALDPQQVVGEAQEGAAVEGEGVVDIDIRANRCTGCDPAQYRDLQQFGARAAGYQANAPGLIRRYLDKTGFGQRHHMLARHTARGKAEGLADFREAGGLAVLRNAIADEGQDRSTFGR
ncbi:hypothetical protein M2401_003783 [Pseudomonas sp. JUb42]|nr:hypothetical protein [Pseudomonas sp. JUb42]